MTTVRELRIALTVDDYERAVAFYRDALGLREVESWDRPNGRGTILDAGRATLELFDPLQAETLDQIEVGRRASGPVRLAIHVDDSAAAADHLVAAGAVREHELVVTPWGDRNARVRAPDGMQLTLFTPAETAIPWSGVTGAAGEPAGEPEQIQSPPEIRTHRDDAARPLGDVPDLRVALGLDPVAILRPWQRVHRTTRTRSRATSRPLTTCSTPAVAPERACWP